MNFCVKCGIDCDSTIDGLCLECFLDGRVLTVLAGRPEDDERRYLVLTVEEEGR